MRAGIALGSNIEPRLAHLQQARRRIEALSAGSDAILVSKVYETSPVDCEEGTANFLNAVMEISFELSPEVLFDSLQQIENEMGRPFHHARNSPRSIDLDILYCGDITKETEKLTIPHPRISERMFVLKPLVDIQPSLRLPNNTKNTKELLKEVSMRDLSKYNCFYYDELK